MNKIYIKSGLAANLASAGVHLGELKFTTDDYRLYVGNGTKNIELNGIIKPVSSLATITAENANTNAFYLLTIDEGARKAGIYYASVSGNVVNWNGVGGQVTWANIDGNVSDNTALWTLLGNVAQLETTSPNLTGAINELKASIEALGSGMTWCGVVAQTTDLPSTGQNNGDMYYVTAESANFVWNDTANDWDELSGSIDLSGLVEKTQTIAGLPLTGNIASADLKNALGVGSAYTYKGVLATIADLNNIVTKSVGDSYYITAESATYAWNGTQWQSIGQTVDTSTLQTKTDNALATTSKTVVGAINELKTDASGNIVKFTYNTSTHTLKLGLYKSDNSTLISETATIDLPIEGLISTVEYVSAIPAGQPDAGKPGLKITLQNGNITYVPLDSLISGMVTETGTQTLTNKTIDADDNTISDLTTSNFKSGTITTTVGDTSTAVDTKLPTEKAVATILEDYVTIAQGSGNSGKMLMVNSSGNLVLTDEIDCGTF